MHDFLLAKEIVDETLRVAKENNLKEVKKVSVEIGQVAMAHDGHDEHVEDISIENLQFGIGAASKGTAAENAEFKIQKVDGDHWKLLEIDGE